MVKNLSQILQSYRTTLQIATEETLYNLIYGFEAVIPTKIGVGSLRIADYDDEAN